MSYYDNLVVCYFSGTGNSLSAVNWIKENADKRNLKTQLCSIEKKETIDLSALSGRTLVGFCYPTHGFIAPWIVLKYLWKFPKIKNADAFFVNTRAGAILYKLSLPGLSGMAQWFSIFLFLLKGFSIKGSLPLDMPHSWISFFPPINKAGINRISINCNRTVNKMCDKMFAGKRYFRYHIWLSLPLDIAIIPIIIPYVFGGRFMLAKTLFASYGCNTCRLCEESCPVQAIIIKDNRPYWKITCESCMRCMNICPKKSIQSWITRIALITYFLMVAGLALFKIDEILLFMIVSCFFLPIYWIVFWALRIKFVNIIFTFTSLTKLWGRYLAPGIKLKALKGKNL
jgi:ferredoxin